MPVACTAAAPRRRDDQVTVCYKVLVLGECAAKARDLQREWLLAAPAPALARALLVGAFPQERLLAAALLGGLHFLQDGPAGGRLRDVRGRRLEGDAAGG